MNECNIVRDLMPLMADELASSDTAEFVRRHLESCPECRSVWERVNGELPAMEQPQPDKKTLKTLLRSMVWMLLKGILIFTAVLCVFMSLVYYYFWENEYLPIQKSFPSTDENYRVDMVDWDTAGFFHTGEGSRVYFRCGNSTWADQIPWDDLDVVWAPNSADAMLIIQTVEGLQEYRILEMSFTQDEASKKSIGSFMIIPYYEGPDLQAVLADKCRAYGEFPVGWEEIRFTFTQWEPDSETVIFHYTTDAQETGFVSYHFPTETITRVYE